MTYAITADLLNALFGICVGFNQFTDCQREIAQWLEPLQQPGYAITADKLNSLYAVCRNLETTECLDRVEAWLTQFVEGRTP